MGRPIVYPTMFRIKVEVAKIVRQLLLSDLRYLIRRKVLETDIFDLHLVRPIEVDLSKCKDASARGSYV